MSETRYDKQTVRLPLSRENDWRKPLVAELRKYHKGAIEIDCQDWFLGCRDLVSINSIVERAGLEIHMIQSSIPETIVSAKGLGLLARLTMPIESEMIKESKKQHPEAIEKKSVFFQQGTLRSGEHLDVEKDVLLLGDVNPGAKISAVGDVMIWGRLLGIAHAGKTGNTLAKITALELRPLQLRIANAIARGPEQKPEQGMAEQATLVSGRIIIEPAKSNSFKGRSIT